MKLAYDDLLGTSFAVTKRHVFTARHVLCENDCITPMFDEATGKALHERKFVISRGGAKVGSLVSFHSPMEVKVARSDEEHDWALLELVYPELNFPAHFQIWTLSWNL